MKHILIKSLAAVGLILLVVTFFTQKAANAELPYFTQAVQTATTSPTYLTTGTTTYTYDAFNGGNNTWGADSATLVLQVVATTTATKINFVQEISQDGIDWYSVATSSTLGANNYSEFQWTFATSTAGLGATGSTTRLHQTFPLTTPLRYTRVRIYNPSIANQSVQIWGNIYARKQQGSR